MNSNAPSNSVVHEAIDERQHVRTRIPAKAVLQGPTGTQLKCDVQEISLGGIGLECSEPLNVGSLYSITIELGLNHIEMSLKAQVKVVNQTDDQVGAQFIDLDPQKADILRYVISAYMTGDIADINGLFNVMQRENYIKERKQKYSPRRSPLQRIQAAAGTLVFMLIGILALGYVANKAYQLFFRIPAAQATVQTQTHIISMPENGNVSLLLPEGTQSVTKGQPVASISTQLSTQLTSPADIAAAMELAPAGLAGLLERTTVETVIASPCDCTLFYPDGQVEGFNYKGAPLVHLLPVDTPMFISASVPYERLEKLMRTREVQIRVYGDSNSMTGHIQSASLDKDAGMVTLKIKPDSPISRESYLRPVWVEFYLGLPGITTNPALARLF